MRGLLVLFNDKLASSDEKLTAKDAERAAVGPQSMTENELSSAVIRHAMKVHSTLGPGLLESAYEACLCYELMQAGLFVE